MGFYEEISDYYDSIFPTGNEQLGFIRKAAGDPPKSLLDIACGTGGYSIGLAGMGYDVTAADIDPSMIEGLKKKLQAQGGNVVCINAGMLDLAGKLHTRFDLAFCIGNSIVHLNGEEEIREFIKSSREWLKEDGVFIIQIINFDRVLSKNITELPAIRNEKAGLTFERFYRFDKTANRIFFKTILTAGNRKIENEIPLYPLSSQFVADMLKEAGFKDVRQFGDFSGGRFDENESFMLVLQASKPLLCV